MTHHIEAATQAITEFVGTWAPENALELVEALSKSFPGLLEAIAAATANAAEKIPDKYPVTIVGPDGEVEVRYFPIHPEVPDHLWEIAGTVAGEGEKAAEMGGIVRAAHKSELDNLERGHTLWDVSINQDGENAPAGSAPPNGSHGQAPANGTGDEIPRAASPDVSGSTGGKGASQETSPASAAGAHAGSAGGAGPTGGGTVGGRGGSGTGEPPRAGAGSGGGDEDNRGHGPNEDPYANLKNMSLEERLELVGRSDVQPTGREIGSINFRDYYEAEQSGKYTGIPLRTELMRGDDGAQNAAKIIAELFSNYKENAAKGDTDARYLKVTADPATGDTIIDYYSIAPVTEKTYHFIESRLYPNNYAPGELEKLLFEGKPRDEESAKTSKGLHDTGRGWAMVVAHTDAREAYNEEPGAFIERVGVGAHVRIRVNPRELTRYELSRVLAIARGQEPPPPPEPVSEEEKKAELKKHLPDDELDAFLGKLDLPDEPEDGS
jgi:hypothetical protein